MEQKFKRTVVENVNTQDARAQIYKIVIPEKTGR